MRIIIRWVYLILISLFIWAIFSYTLNYPLNHNEQMYIASGVLGQQNSLYQDFAYLQTPYLPLIYSKLFLFPGTNYLFIARFFTALVLLASGLMTYLINKSLLKDTRLALNWTFFFLVNEIILVSAREVSNYALPLLLALINFYLLVKWLVDQKKSQWLIFSSGLVLALAYGVKLSYLIFLIPNLIVLLVWPKESKISQRFKLQFTPFFLGFLVGSIPILYYLITRPVNFIFNNLTYHRLNVRWKIEAGQAACLDWLTKFSQCGREVLLLPSTLIIIILLVIILLWLYQSKTSLDSMKKMGFVLLLFIFASLIATFYLTPTNIQYFILLMPYLIILLISLNKFLPFQVQFWLPLFSLMLILFFSHQSLFSFNHNTLKPATKNTPKEIYQQAKNLREIIGQPGKVATLSPIYPLEAGLEIYPEFATGPFLYRISDYLTEKERQEFTTTSPQTISQFLDQNPPIAILAVEEGELDKPLINYALEKNYSKIESDLINGQLYVKKN